MSCDVVVYLTLIDEVFIWSECWYKLMNWVLLWVYEQSFIKKFSVIMYGTFEV